MRRGGEVNTDTPSRVEDDEKKKGWRFHFLPSFSGSIGPAAVAAASLAPCFLIEASFLSGPAPASQDPADALLPLLSVLRQQHLHLNSSRLAPVPVCFQPQLPLPASPGAFTAWPSHQGDSPNLSDFQARVSFSG